MFLLGGLCFIGGMLFANHIIPGSNKTKKSNEEEYDETHEDNGKIVRIPYSAEEITFEMLNNPKHPKYIGHLLISAETGAQYNL